MNDDTKREPDRRPRPQHQWIRERLEQLRRRDELLRQIGYSPTEARTHEKE